MTFLAAASCSPREKLDEFIHAHHFIPFNQPTELFRVGALVHGSALDPQPVGNPKDGARLCFPDRDPSLRFKDPVVLENQERSAEVAINAEINPVIAAGNNVFTFKVGANAAHSVKMEFTGAQIEYLDEDAFWDYYANEMSAKCKNYLHRKGYAFISRALYVEGMKFVFLDQAGGLIDLKLKLGDVIDIKGDVKWSLKDQYTLVIETPKYLGYQMARLISSEGGGDALQIAKEIDFNGNWDFRDIDPRLESFLPVDTRQPADPL